VDAAAAISVAAGAPEIPVPLVEQLQVGGRLVAPISCQYSSQRLIRVLRTEDDAKVEDLLEVAFVFLVGQAGWPEAKRPESE
jgi:protein-L-isoaspartate(D-aspartate) O-methyltransferase